MVDSVFLKSLNKVVRSIIAVLFMSFPLLSCTRNLPDHALVPEDAIFVARSPSQGVSTRGNCCYGYGEKYTISQHPEAVVDFYMDHGFDCEPYSDQVFEFESNIWFCRSNLSENISVRTLIMSQDEIKEDFERLELASDQRRYGIFMGHWFLINEQINSSDETMIVTDIEGKD